MSDWSTTEIVLPWEWALKKAFGPVLGELGEDMKKLYSLGRDKIILKAYNKIFNKDDNKKVNLRVARDVFWNWSFSDEEICAEYFGWILASSRSEDGSDDNGINYTDTIKSLSSKQLFLHYVIYNSLNKLFVEKNKYVNVGLSSELNMYSIWFSSLELMNLGLRIDTDLNVLYKQWLLQEYKTDKHSIEEQKNFPYIMIKPTTFGILLYTIANNKFDDWSVFSTTSFGDFENIRLPKYFASSIDELLIKIWLKKSDIE